MKKVTSCRPAGHQVLIRRLTSAEIAGTKLHLSENVNLGAPQGYIVSVGPMVDCEKNGYKVGDRVLVTGNFTPVPSLGDEHEYQLIEPHVIKGILDEVEE